MIPIVNELPIAGWLCLSAKARPMIELLIMSQSLNQHKSATVDGNRPGLVALLYNQGAMHRSPSTPVYSHLWVQAVPWDY